MAILITGGLGYLGSHTATVFADAGYDLVIVDNLSNTDISVLAKLETIVGKKIPFYDFDIRDKDGLSKIFSAHSISGVVHFAALKSVGESCENPFAYYDNNVLGTLSLLEVMDLYGVKKIVFSSSATVYDPHCTPPFVETDRLDTTNPYGTTKLIIEYVLKDMMAYKGFQVVCLRYFNPIGAHPSGLIGEDPSCIPNNLLPYIFKVVAGDLSELRVFGNDYETIDGTGVRDYLHVMDLARAHLVAYQREGFSSFEIFNIGTGQGTSVLEMIAFVENITGHSIPYSIVSRRSGDVALSLANPQKAYDVLGWRTIKTVEDAIRDGWNFIQKNNSGK